MEIVDETASSKLKCFHVSEPIPLNYQSLFEALPGLYLILYPDLKIATASEAYLKATMTKLHEIKDRDIFDVFPDNPNDPVASGETNLRASLNYVLQTHACSTMAIQKYDIRKPDGGFEERFWSPINKPVLDSKQNLVYIIHRVEDVTDFIRLTHKQETNRKDSELLQDLVSKFQSEVYLRAQEIQKINSDLIKEVDERKRAEENAKRAQTFLQSSLEGNRKVMIFSIDKQYRFLVFNSCFRNSTLQAYGTDVKIGMNLLDIIPNEFDREKARKNCDRAMGGEYHVTIEEYGDLKRSCFETRYNPMIDHEGEIIGVTVFSADVTERVVAETRITALNNELEAFAYSVSHDLRAPLRSINGYANVMLEDYGKLLDENGQKTLAIIMSNAIRMGQLIDAMLEFSKLGRSGVSKSRSHMDNFVKPLVNEMLQQQNGRKIRMNILPLGGYAEFDSIMLRQVWTNLISNAIKYSSKKEESRIEIGSVKTDAPENVYYIRDNGAGFDMNYTHKLFGVFQRLHKAKDFEGSGVGLALTKRIIDKHGGRIWAEASVNEGAVFYFTLPL